MSTCFKTNVEVDCGVIEMLPTAFAYFNMTVGADSTFRGYNDVNAGVAYGSLSRDTFWDEARIGHFSYNTANNAIALVFRDTGGGLMQPHGFTSIRIYHPHMDLSESFATYSGSTYENTDAEAVAYIAANVGNTIPIRLEGVP